MFATAVPLVKEPINLDLYKSFEDKLMAVYSYTKISDIYIEVSNPQDVEAIYPVDLSVVQMAVPPGSPSYVNSKLKDCYNILSDEVMNYINGTDDFDDISKALESSIEKCIQGAEENNINDIFTFDQNLIILIYNKGKWFRTLFQYLQWPIPALYENLQENFNVRKGFFDKMGKTLNKALESHKLDPDPATKPYTWDSPNAELEITELLYIIYRTSGQLKIDFKSGGSFPKFKRDFFKLFGLADKNYDKKVGDILKRKKGQHFVNHLSQKFDEDHAKLFEVKK